MLDLGSDLTIWGATTETKDVHRYACPEIADITIVKYLIGFKNGHNILILQVLLFFPSRIL